MERSCALPELKGAELMEQKSTVRGKHRADTATSTDRRCLLYVSMFALLLVVYRLSAGFGAALASGRFLGRRLTFPPASFKTQSVRRGLPSVGEEIERTQPSIVGASKLKNTRAMRSKEGTLVKSALRHNRRVLSLRIARLAESSDHLAVFHPGTNFYRFA